MARGKLPKLQTNKFEAESIGLDLGLAYSIGRFTFQPDYYVDYYLPQTDEKRFTGIFNVNLGFSF